MGWNMHIHLTDSELVVALLLACYGGVIGAALAIAYALARTA